MGGKIIAIIPARGGSKGIPRKNARLLHGKPLLAYSVESALKVPRVDAVYVSTDDPELAMIGRRSGARIVERPARLAEDHITLDEVIVDAVDRVEAQGQSMDYIVTIQATSPLIAWRSIDAAISKCIHNGLDTVVSLIDNRHLRWGENSKGDLVRLYKQRINRQELPREYRETGGVVVCKRSALRSGSRFGSKVGAIELSKTEAIDIDDRFDWWLAEKSLSRRKVCFHVTGNRESGTGHVHRALTIADRMIDHEVWFLVNEDSKLAGEIIAQRFYPCTTVKPGSEIAAILANKPHLVINDILDTTVEFMKALKRENIVTINFEDLGKGSVHADYVINEMYGNHPGRSDGRIFSGEKYCCLRDEFYSATPIEGKPVVENILLMFGGTDPNNLTLRILNWLDELKGEWRITVILGRGYPEPRAVEELAKKANHPIEIVANIPVVSPYMSKTDIAVTSAGRTVFELASLGIPSIVISQNKRETTHAFAHASPGLMALGLHTGVSRKQFQRAVMELLKDKSLRKSMHKHLRKAEIRKGIDRVYQIIERALREGENIG